MKEFEIKNVVTINFFCFPLAGLIIGGGILFLYSKYGFKYFGIMGLIIVGFVILCLLFFLLSALAGTIKIKFSKEYIYLQIGNEERKYLKKEIKGFYSHDYKKTSNISIQIQFTNGKKIEITDAKDFTTKYNREKGEMLQDFLKTAQKELGFRSIKKDKIRTFKQMGATWYSKS